MLYSYLLGGVEELGADRLIIDAVKAHHRLEEEVELRVRCRVNGDFEDGLEDVGHHVLQIADQASLLVHCG